MFKNLKLTVLFSTPIILDLVPAAGVAEIPNLKVGYHSPPSAPKIVPEGALKAFGIKVTEDSTPMSAQVFRGAGFPLSIPSDCDWIEK